MNEIRMTPKEHRKMLRKQKQMLKRMKRRIKKTIARRTEDSFLHTAYADGARDERNRIIEALRNEYTMYRFDISWVIDIIEGNDYE